MRALECERPCGLLIDELDKVDDGFEATAEAILKLVDTENPPLRFG